MLTEEGKRAIDYSDIHLARFLIFGSLVDMREPHEESGGVLMRYSITALVIGLLSATTVYATEGDQELQKLINTVDQESASNSSAKDAPSGSKESLLRMAAQQSAAQLRSAVASGDKAAIAAALTQLSRTVTSDDLRKQCDDLLAKLKAEREAEEKAAVANINGLLKRAGDAVRSAKTPADLDGTIKELAEHNRQDERQSSSREMNETQKKVGPTLQYATRWQNYLSDRAAGESEDAVRMLRELSNDTQVLLIPRSEILDLIAHPQVQVPLREKSTTQPIAEIVSGIKTPDDLSHALEQLKELQNHNGEPVARAQDLNKTIESLASLDRAYHEFKAGLPTKINVVLPSAGYNEVENLTAPIRAQVITLVLPRYLGLPEGTQAKQGEGPYQFLDRVATDAVARNDYLLAAKIRQTQRFLRDGTDQNNEQGSQAGLFVTACNQEAAGQYSLAVTSYEKALAQPSDLVPPKVIGERLAGIKAKYPDEYQKGVDNYLTPPMARFANPFGAMGYPTRPPVSQPRPGALEVPAASPSSTPAASATPSKP